MKAVNPRAPPFGIQQGRFDVSGLHPRMKKPGSFTEIPYDHKWMDSKTRRRGPGLYFPDMGGFSPEAVEVRSSGPGWAREEEVEQLAAIPYLLNRDLFEHRKELKRKVGPGSYNLKDFIQLSEKPGSLLGICEPRADRFGRARESITPGPGTYGKNGIPHTVIEEKNQRSQSNKGLMDSDSRQSRYQMAVGCRLGPGTYTLPHFIDQFVDRMVSIRGPYDLFSGDRTKPVITGHLATPNNMKVCPGQYNVKPCSILEDFATKAKKLKGKIGKVARYPRFPPERIFYSTLCQCPRDNVVGPGAYYPSNPGSWPAVKNNAPAFQSTTQRADRRAQRSLTGNYNSVGVGRYNITRFDEAQHKNGHQSVFKVKHVQPSYPSEHYLKERIRSKDIPKDQRHIPVGPQGLPFEEKRRPMYHFTDSHHHSSHVNAHPHLHHKHHHHRHHIHGEHRHSANALGF